jgi:transcriptional regulator with XRE-family HTH domain
MLTLGQVIRRQGLRQRAVAEQCGVTDSAISRWSRREVDIPVGSVKPLAEALGVTVEEILSVATKAPKTTKESPHGPKSR